MPGTKEHRRFCQNDGWELYKSTDHDFYRKLLPNGVYLTTFISRGTKEYSPEMFAKILKQQLHCDKTYFNSKI